MLSLWLLLGALLPISVLIFAARDSSGRLSLGDLYRWEGAISRFPYFAWGTALFALKHNVDRLIAEVYFKRKWHVFSYLFPDKTDSFTADDAKLLLAIAAASLPFLGAGVILTLKRLRAVRLPGWLVVLFVMPFINILFFGALSALPDRPDAPEPPAPDRSRWLRFIPDNPLGSAIMSQVLTLPFAVALMLLSTELFRRYGWGLFVGLPFCQGLAAVLLYGFRQRRPFGECLTVAALSAALLALALLLLAIEGVFCISMAAPLGLLFSAFGGVFGWAIQGLRPAAGTALRVLLLTAGGLPVLMGFERLESPEAPLIAVRTSVEIEAAPATVWRNVVSFSELPPPRSFLFRHGVAYPIRAEIEGTGPGAIRRCVFSTGEFVEPIEVWEEPRLLRFSVTDQPTSMRELTPYGHIAPPHVEGFLVSSGGQFLLTELPGGRTRLEGTTWYRHHLWPAAYWRLWSDAVIHRIHGRVLEHIKDLSERG